MNRCQYLLFALFLLLVSAYAPHAEESSQQAAPELDRARLLLKEGRGEDAWALLARLLRAKPDSIEVNVLLSQAAFATGRDNQALAALERLCDFHPQNASLHLALAKAYALAGDEASSSVEMAEALRLDPKIASTDEREDLEKAAKLSARRFDRFMATGRLAMGVIWDSNATCGVDSLDIEIGDYNFHLHEDAEKKAAFGEYLNGNLSWSYKLAEDSTWHLAGDFAAYGKIYNEDLPANRSFTWGRAAVGLREVSGRHMFDLRGVANNASWEPFESSTGLGGEATWLYQLLPGFDFILRGALESRTYMEYDGKNGLYWNAGLYGRLHFGDSGNTLLAGIKGIGSQTDEERFSYDGFEAMARLDVALLRKLTVSPFAAWRHSAFHGAATRLSATYGEDNRMDDLLMAGVGLTWSWTEHIATEIGWQYIKNNSTSPLYRYDQHQANMGMVFSF